MIHLSTRTPDSSGRVIEKAYRFFGPYGFGLRMVSRDDKNIQLEGGGGHVSVNTSLEHGETEVDIQSQEWERQAQRFLDRL